MQTWPFRRWTSEARQSFPHLPHIFWTRQTRCPPASCAPPERCVRGGVRGQSWGRGEATRAPWVSLRLVVFRQKVDCEILVAWEIFPCFLRGVLHVVRIFIMIDLTAAMREHRSETI